MQNQMAPQGVPVQSGVLPSHPMGLRNAGVGGWGFMPPPNQPFDPSKVRKIAHGSFDMGAWQESCKESQQIVTM